MLKDAASLWAKVVKVLIKSHEDLDVWQRAFALANEIFEVSKSFPKIETYSLTDQIRRSSRSVCAQIAEAWEMRRYDAAFKYKLTLACAESAETQSWLRSGQAAQYIEEAYVQRLFDDYLFLCRSLNGMILHSKRWTSTNSVGETTREYGLMEEPPE